ncbi:MAG TPA: hypothetical protein ENK43_07880 [Planctomycetes bacterium]|nr:hypothetical protein [Planctomycetota bacterium]
MSQRPGRSLLALAAFMLVAVTSTVLAQDGEKEGPQPIRKDANNMITFRLQPEGVPLEKFVASASVITGKTFVFDPRRLSGKVINMIGTKKVAEEDVFSFLQVLFFAHDLAVLPIGPPETEVLLIEDIKTSQSLKDRAKFVTLDELETRRRRVGEILAVTIPLKYIPVEKAQRALTNIIQEHRAGFVQTIEEANSLLIVNFAPKVWTMYQILKAMDVPVEANELKFEKIALEYHVAEELGPIIESLMEARTDISSSGGAPSPGRGRPARPSSSGNTTPAPKIIPDPRTNSLLVYAIDDYMTEIKNLVADLDVEVTEPNSNIHIYELKNTNAEDIQDVLTQLLQGTGGRSVRPTGAGGSRGRNSSAGRGGLGQTSNPDEVNIVADPNTNSLLITATKARFEELAEIITRLDQRRPQVLVQAAIAELTSTDLQNIGVELAQVEGGGAETRLFGATAFGLSTIDTRQNVLGGGTTGGDGTGTGGGTTGGTTSSTDQFFSDLIRVPNLDAQGLVGGIFRNFVEVPILVQLFKQVISGNLVSVPSIMVNDNQEAHITIGTEVPTTSVNQGQFSDQVSFQGYQEANLEMLISPTISNDNYLRLDIEITIQAFTGAQASFQVPPPRTTRSIVTSVTVQSGRTVVIGGLTTDNYRETLTGVPFLSDIPVLGELFKSTSESREKTTLYVFITPTILSDFEALEKISYDRKLEIAKLDGQIHIVDPNFREIDLDDEELSIEDIESTGLIDLPKYRPSVAIEGPQPPPRMNADGVPAKPPVTTPQSKPRQQDEGADSSKKTTGGEGARTPGSRRPGERPRRATMTGS